MLVTPPTHTHILVTTPSSKCLEEAEGEADAVLEGRNSIRQHAKTKKGTRERPGRNKDAERKKRKKKKKEKKKEERETRRKREQKKEEQRESEGEKVNEIREGRNSIRLAGWLATDCLFKNCGAATKSRVVSTTNRNSIPSIKTAH